MELGRESKRGLTLISLAIALGATACNTVVENNINSCDDSDNGTNVVATMQPGVDGYQKSTDPYLIDKAIRKDASNKGLFDQPHVGIGRLVCVNKSQQRVLTVTALEYERSHHIS